MLKNLIAGIAAIGLAFAPIAVQANTRAADSAVSLSALTTPLADQTTVVDDDDDDDFGGLWWLFGGAIAIGVLLAIGGDASEGNTSFGAN